MADRPILFSASMIRALLAGTKTQTRRLLKPQPSFPFDVVAKSHREGLWWAKAGREPWLQDMIVLPYTPGDRLWVREQFSVTNDGCYPSYIRFRADPEGTPGIPCNPDKRYGSRTEWRPSIHMPRWASRLTLTVAEVRVQRLQEISEADAKAEGYFSAAVTPICDGPDCETDLARSCSRGACDVSKRWYADLWTSLHGPGSWEANPWVVAVSFDVRKGNIDG